MTMEDDSQTAGVVSTAYETPRALRLGRTRGAIGAEEPPCEVPGSSALGDCISGFAAGIMCYQTGNGAEKCDGPGNDATELPPD
jgi:hypothetical protein